MTHKDEKKELSSNFECAVILCHKVYGLVVMYISSLCSRLKSSAHNQSATESGSIESKKIIETSNPMSWVGRDLSWFDSHLSQKFINRSIKKNAFDSRSTTHSVSHNSINSYCVCYFVFFIVCDMYKLLQLAICILLFHCKTCERLNDTKIMVITMKKRSSAHISLHWSCSFNRESHLSLSLAFLPFLIRMLFFFPPSIFLIYYL